MKNKTKLRIKRTVAVSFAALAIGSAVVSLNQGFKLIDNSVETSDLEDRIEVAKNEMKTNLDLFKETDFFKWTIEEENRISLERLQSGELSEGEYTLHMAYVNSDAFAEDILELSDEQFLKRYYFQLADNVKEANDRLDEIRAENTPYVAMTICAGIATMGAICAAYGSWPFNEEEKEK